MIKSVGCNRLRQIATASPITLILAQQSKSEQNCQGTMSDGMTQYIHLLPVKSAFTYTFRTGYLPRVFITLEWFKHGLLESLRALMLRTWKVLCSCGILRSCFNLCKKLRDLFNPSQSSHLRYLSICARKFFEACNTIFLGIKV